MRQDIGMKRGKGYAVNVPLRDGIRDESFHSIFKPVSLPVPGNYLVNRIQVVAKLIEFFRPGAIVLQMGADSIAGDKLGGFNMTLQGESTELPSSVTEIPRSRGVRKICQKLQPAHRHAGRRRVYYVGDQFGARRTLSQRRKNVARAWTLETAVMCGRELSEDLPYNQ